MAESPALAEKASLDPLEQVEDTIKIDATEAPLLDQPSVNTGTSAQPGVPDLPEPSPTRTNSELRCNRKPQNRPGTPGEQRQDHTTARKAEVWLREQIRQHLAEKPFNVDEGVHRDDENRESDIRIQALGDGSDWHVEVKHLSGNLIYWSELEIGKAKDHAPRYFMVLLSGENEPFEITWLWDPLESLGELPSHVEWIWQEVRKPLFHPPEDEWLEVGLAPERPEATPRRSHRIEIPNDLRKSPEPLQALDVRLFDSGS